LPFKTVGPNDFSINNVYLNSKLTLPEISLQIPSNFS